MYIVTGAAGFIGSCMASALAKVHPGQVVWVDDFSRPFNQSNWGHVPENLRVDREQFWVWVKGREHEIDAIVHLGARTDTAEMDKRIFDHLNLNYSKQMWSLCVTHGIPLIYASSAATYGDGEFGFDDDHALVEKLQPLNPYGESKNEFDRWVLQQPKQPEFWAGLKFFNVYGPNEYHKSRMASVIFHAFGQIEATGGLKLFRSHRADFADGMQSRDFIYVKDVVSVILFLLEKRPGSAIYNLGTGKARPFLDLGLAVFKALGRQPDITFVDTPLDIRDKYQYFTEANMKKLREAGYADEFWSLEDGVEDYVKNFLVKKTYLK